MITYTFEESSNFGCDSKEVFVPEAVLLVPEKFNECDQCTPGMGAMDKESFQ